MQFVPIGLLVILLIGFFVVVWKAAPEWRWFNIVAVCITMILAILFLFPTAGVLASRSAWHQIKEKLEVQAADVLAENKTIKYGDPDDPAAGEGIVELDRKLAKIGTEAGRRWRNLQMQNVANNNITLADIGDAGIGGGIPADPNAPAEPAPTEPLIPQELVVYGFAETASQNADGAGQSLPLPNFYLGEFRVVSSTPTQVVLSPTGKLEANQLQAISSKQAKSWSLYELLPLDGHHPFIAEGSLPSDDNFLGRMDDARIDQLLANRVTPETLAEYTRDGGRNKPDDPLLTRWQKIEFTQNHSLEVDSPEQRGALDGGFFDESGRAVDSRLQRGEDGSVKFKKSDQIVIKEESATKLIETGVAELRDTYYLRPLNDYRYVLRRIRLRLTELANRTQELEFEKKVLEEAIAKSEGMIVTNQVIKDKLEQDRDQFTVENKSIKAYTDNIQTVVKQMKSDMARLHSENIALEKRLDQLHFNIEQRLDAVTMAR
ncbi:MAG: hypothetical protein P8L85_17920 [Rubripirellula sp.]|nr:hypothetical protein [Rubripirellula sp.]